MRARVIQRQSVQPVVIGADLIQEAREIERQRVLYAARRAIEKIPTTTPDPRNTWSVRPRDVKEYRESVLGALADLEVGA